ncbi:baseplate hub subunit and tail lysozyme [Acinetobacter phage vB_AbaM_Konradin]|uniref:Pre-baseplate central spike protein n=1 Tax=Acinetobacter phage vB_AbaM_Konradin TaxID=2666257 RepID=A0A650EV97_9CAUD|nr:baseplate hub subunit and tail lysozyme [Acinetobacter phage vB_AbaM_Konradin]QGT53920.1 cell puncturing device and tail lysozyme [Acinetobacter phage vB_AbaM_Konradin]
MRLQSDDVKWWVGVVEDRLDPLQQGRVRVRVVGVHPFSRIQGEFSGLPVEDLPWMSVLLPVTTPAVAGVSGAVTGLLPGSGVFGIWLDKYKTNGLVLGSYSGNQVNIPNSEEGFSDPSGQYPDYAGPDSSALNAGGAYGDAAGANASQNANSSTGLWPGGADISGPDDSPNFTIEKMLRGDEGVKNTVYWDHLGYPTIGIGHLILYRKTRDMGLILKKLSSDLGRSVGATISQADISKLFVSDLGKTQAEIKKNRITGPVYAKCNRSRQMALENMAFQMGTGGLAKFKKSLALMAEEKWDEAAKQLKNSLWARQTPGRANRVCMVIKNGNLGAYGVIPRKPQPNSKSLSAVQPLSMGFMDNNFDPYDKSDTEIYPSYDTTETKDGIDEDLSVPYVREPSATLFVEPNSSYQGNYPYVQALTTEGGHSQEFDNTPGQERYRIRHPSGSYVEVAPDGRKTDKCTGDLYHLTEGDRNELTSGERRVNVGGNETYINFADVVRQIEGSNSTKIAADNTIEVAGNETRKITGDGTIEVSGNLKIIVAADASIEVGGNANLKVSGNLTSNISGNYNMTVGGTYTINSGTVNWNAPRYNMV